MLRTTQSDFGDVETGWLSPQPEILDVSPQKLKVPLKFLPKVQYFELYFQVASNAFNNIFQNKSL